MEQLNLSFRKLFLFIIILFLSGYSTFAQNAGSDENVACTNAQLDALDSETGVWTTGGGATINDATNPNTTVTGLSAGINTFTWTVGGSTDDVDITYIVAEAGPNQPTACASTALAADNPAPLSGYWTVVPAGIAFDDSTLPTANVSNLPVGSTNFSWTVTSGAGCSNSDIVAITNNTPVADAGLDDETCTNNSIQLNGNDPTISGATGKWTRTSGLGTLVDETLYNTVVNGLDPDNINEFQWEVTKNGCPTIDLVQITNNTVTAIARDVSVCGTSATLDADVTPSGASGQWSVISSTGTVTTTAQNNSPVTGLNIDDNTFKWTLTKGICSNSINIVVTNNQPTVSAGPDDESCDGSITMNGNNPSLQAATGQWTLSGGAAAVDGTLYNTVVNNINVSPPSSTFTWTVTKGSCSADDVVVITNNYVTALVTDKTVCASNTTLDGNNPALLNATGKWTIVGSNGIITTTAQYNSSVTNLDPGVNTFRWTLTKGTCTDDEVMTITRDNIVADAGSDVPNLCANNTTLDAINPAAVGATGQWSVGTPGSGSFGVATLYNTTVTGLSQGDNEFIWTVTKGSCSDNDNVIITNITPVMPNAGADQPLLCANTTTLAANDPGTDNGLWAVVSGSGNFVDNTLNSTIVNNLGAGANEFSWTITSSVDVTCTFSNNVIITNNQPANVDAGPVQHVCITTATMSASSPGAGTGTWTPRSGSGNITTPNSSITNLTALGTGLNGNTFRWTVTINGCDSYDEVTIYNDTPATAIAGADDVSCDGTFDPLGGNNPPVGYGTGLWTAGAGVVFANDTEYNTSVSGLSLGDNILTWTISKGACFTTSDVTIVYDEITPADAGIDQPVLCVNTTTMAATDPAEGTGLWTVVTGTGTFANDTEFNSVVTNVGRGNNTYRWTVTKGICPGDADEVLIRNYSVEAQAGNDDDICETNYILQGNPAAAQFIGAPANITDTGEWSVNPSSVVFNNSFIWNATVSNLSQDANTFTWTMTNGYCTDVDQVIINNYRPITPDAGVDTTFCGIDQSSYSSVYTQLKANNPTRAGEIGVWTVTAGHATFLDATTDNEMRIDDLDHYAQTTGPDYWNQHPVINTFSWTITYHNCELSDEVNIVNAAPFAANAGPDQDVCYDEVNLNATDHGWGAQTHVWTEQAPGGSGAVIANPDEFNSYVSALQSGQTTFRWTKENTLNIFGKGNTTCTLWDDVIIDRILSTGRPNAGDPQAVCSTEAIMSASPANKGFSISAPETVVGQWSVLVGGGNFADGNSPSTLVTNLHYRTNIFRWTVTYDDGAGTTCIATDDVDILNALPSNANTGPNQNVCANTALLSADRPTRGTGAWSVTGGGGTITNETCQDFLCTAYVYDLGTAQNTFLWTMTYNYTDPASGLPDKCELTDQIEVWNWELTANAGADQYVCVDNATIEANQPNGTTGVWDRTGGGGNITTPNSSLTTITSLSPNLNTFRWTLDNGHCTAEDYINITNNNPDDPVAGGDQILCSNTTNLAANNPINGTGEWSVALGGGIITSSLLETTGVTNIPQGQNTYRWTITKGIAPNTCSEEDLVDVYNNSVSPFAGTDIDDVCGFEVQNSSVYLSAATPNYPNGETGIWTVFNSTGTIQTPTLRTSQVTGMDRGENIFRWTLSNTRGTKTCSEEDFVSVFVYIPSLAAAGGNQTVCNNAASNITLTATNPVHGNGTWTIVSGGGNIANPTNFTTTVNNLALDRSFFRWSVVDNPLCPASTDEVMITNNYVTANAGPDQAICISIDTMAANDPNTYYGGFEKPSGKWTVIQGVGLTFDSDTRYNAIVSNLDDAQTNRLQWRVEKGACWAVDVVSIINNEFTIDAGVGQTVCNISTSLNGQQPGASQTGVWTVDAGGGNFVNSSLYNTQVNGLVQYPQANTLRWTVTNTTSDNCSATDIMTVYYNKVEAYAGVDDRECTNTTTLNADAPAAGLSGNWTVLTGAATVDFPTAYNSTVSNMGIGQNTFTWTVSRTVNGQYCEDVDAVDIYNDTPSDAIVEADKEACSNSSTLNVVTMPVEGTGIWTAVDNLASIDDISSQNANVAGLNLGINTFRWTVTKNLCPKTDDLVITNNEVVANAGVDKSTVCADNTTLSANNPDITQGIGVWTDLDATSAIFTENTLYNTTVTSLRQGTTHFRWTVSMGTCPPVFSDVAITNNQINAVINTNQVNICGRDDYGPLDGNDVSGVGTGVWSSGNPAITFGNNTVYNTTVDNLPTGDNVLTWMVTSDAESCTDNATVTVSNNSVSPNAGANFETCDADITLGASPPSRGSGVWTASGPTSVTFDDSTDPATGVDGLISGIYIFRWTLGYSGCSDYDEVQVTNNTPSPAAATTPTPEICNNASPQLNTNPLLAGETGLWTKVGSSGGTIDDATNNNTFVTALPLGNNIYRWTLSKGNSVVCHTQAEVTINNNTVVAEAGDPKDICSTTTNLAGNNPNDTQGSGLWSGGAPATIANNSVYNSGISGIPDNTPLTFTWTVSKGGCSEFDNVIITNGMVLADAGSTDATCFDNYTLDGNDVSTTGASGIWTKQTGSPASFVHDTQYNTVVNLLAPGINIFTWTVTSANGCVHDDDVSITYNHVVANAGDDVELCESSTNLSAIISPPGSGYWQQTGGSSLGITNSTDPNATITGMVGGNYTFRWTFSNNGCSDDDDVLIINSSPQQATANAGIESCNGTGSLTGNTPNPQETGLWVKVDAGGTITNASLENATVSGMKQGDNVYKWTLSKGNTRTCVSEATVTIPNNQLFTVVATSGSGLNTTCDGTISLSGTNPVDENADRGEWVVNTGANIAISSLYQTTASNLALDANVFTWTLYKGGCDESAQVTINNNSATAQITSPTGVNMEVCDGTVNLTASSSTGSGVWSLVSGSGVIQNSLNTATTVTGLEKNNNIFRWTVDNGTCTATDEITIVNNQVFPQANNKNVCEELTRLPGIDPDIVDNSIDAHYWTNSGGTAAIVQNSTEYNSWVNNLAPTVNSFRWYLEKGRCVDYVEIQVNNQGVVASANDVTTCAMPVALDGSPPPAGANGLWSHVAGSYTFVDDNTLYNASITDIPNGNSASLVWTVTKGICSDATDPITVTNNNFALSAGNDAPTCDGEIQLNGQNIAGGSGFWKGLSGAGIFDNSTDRATWVRSLANDNVFRWTVDNGNCTNHADVTITNNQVVAQISNATMVVCESSATLNAINPLPHTGTWTSLDATANPPTVVTPSAYNSLVTGLKAGSNQFRWLVSGNGGCTDDEFLNIVNDTVILASDATTEICANSTSLWANDPSPNTGVWNSVGLYATVQSSTQYDSPISNLDPTNTFYWTVTSANAGCKTIQRFDVTNNLPTSANAGSDAPNYCFDSYQLNGNSPLIGTGKWTVVSGNGNFDANTLRDTYVRNLQAGPNEFKWTITSIADNTCYTESNVIINSNAIEANAGLNQPNLCNTTTNLNAILNKPATESGYWTPIGGSADIDNSLSATSLVTDLSKGNNTFRWNVSNVGGCTDDDDVLIVNNIPTKPITDPDIDDCFSTQSVIATAPPTGGTGLWTVIGGSGTFDNPTNYNPVVISGLSNQNTNQFEWTVTTNGCSSSDIITIVNNGVSADADPDAYTCDDFYTLRASTPNAGTGVWTVLNGNGQITNSLSESTPVTNLDQVSNGFRWTVTRGSCFDFDDVYITNNAPDDALPMADINTCDATGNSLLGNNPGIGSGLWTKFGGSTATITVPSLYNTGVTLPVKANTYDEIFTWTITNPDGNGGVCTSSSTVTVNQNGFINSANADDYTCDGTYALTGRTTASVSASATGLWSVVSGAGTFGNSLANATTVSDLNLDANTLVWTITNVVNGGADDCVVSENVVITNDMVIAQINFGDGMTCDNYQALSANDPALLTASGIWTLPNPNIGNPQTIDNASEFNTTVRNLSSGNNLLEWTVTKNACIKIAPITVEYYVPNAYIQTGDVTHQCSAETPLVADAPPVTGSGLWTLKFGSPTVTIANASLANTTASNLEIGDNIFVWTVTDRACSATDEVSINNSMPINTVGSDQNGCTADFNMNAQEPTATGSGLWTNPVGTASFEYNTLFSTQVTVARGSNTLRWTITDNGCDEVKDFEIINNSTNPQAGSNVPVCVNEVTLAAADPTPDQGVWTIYGIPQSEVFDDASIFNATVTNLRKGKTTFEWTVSNGICTSSDFVEVTNNTPPITAGADRTICDTKVTMAGNNPALDGNTGIWSHVSNTGVITSPTLYNTQVTDLAQGTNEYTWTVTNGTCTIAENVIITNDLVTVTAGIDQSICADTYDLQAQAPPLGATGLWTALTGSATFGIASIHNTTVSNLSSGSNLLRWTVTANGCPNSKDITLTSLLPTHIAQTEADKPVCEDYATMSANSPDYAHGETGLWTRTGGSIIANPSLIVTDVTDLDQGINTFIWTIDNNGCPSSDNLIITNNEVFADAGFNQPNICDSSATISASVINGTGYWTTTSLTAKIGNSLMATTNVSSLSFGVNNFQWTITHNSCTKTDEVSVTSILPRNVSAGDDQNICKDWTNLAGTNPGIGTGLWANIGGSTNISFVEPSANQTIVSGLGTNDNNLSWTVTVNGCSVTDEITITNNSIYVVAGTDESICDVDTLVLANATQPGIGEIGTWSVSGGSGTFDNNSVYNTTVKGIGKGKNTYKWTLADGSCTNNAEKVVTNNTPDLAIVGADQPNLCVKNTTINAIPVSVGTGLWSLESGGGFIVTPSSNNTDIIGLNSGDNIFRWTVTKNGCPLFANITVTNNSVDVYIPNKEVTICTPTHTATIIGNAPGTGETGYWTKQQSTDAGDISTSASNVTNVTNLDNGDTYFTWTIENGSCSNSDDLRVTNNYYNTTANPAGPNTLCVDYSPILGGVPPSGGTGLWTSTALDVTFDDDTQVSTVVRDLPGGTSSITWTVTKDGCSAPASFPLINNAIYTSAGDDQIVCQNNTNLNAQALLAGESGVWTVDNTFALINATADPASAVSNLIAGNNTFTWTLSGNSCTAVDQVIVSDNSFSVTAGNNDIACGTSYNLAASDPLTGTGLWTISSGIGSFANASNYETVVSNIDNGPNTYTWTVKRNGCEADADVTITNDLYIAVAGDNQQVCDDQTTVTAQPLNPIWGVTGLWTVQNGAGTFDNPSMENSLITGLAYGDNRLGWTVSKGSCVSYDEIIVTNNTPVISAGTPRTTCDDFITLNATPLTATGVGLWSGGGVTTTIVDSSSSTTLVTGLAQGTNTFAWTVTDNNCSATSTVQITSNYFTAIAGSNQVVTVNNTLMAAQLPDVTATGLWSVFSGSGDFADLTNPTEPVTNLGYGVNVFSWTVTWNSCTSDANVSITYNAITAEAGPQQVICTDITYLAADDPFPGTGTWSLINGSAAFDNIHDPNTRVTGIQPGSVNVFRWTVEIGGYEEFDDVTVLNSEFSISAGLDKEECGGGTVMTAESAGSGTGTWSVLTGGGNFADNTLNTTAVTNMDEGINLFVWSVLKPSGCSNSDTVKITYNLPPTAAFEVDPASGCTPVDVTITNTSINGISYRWDFSDRFMEQTSLSTIDTTFTSLFDKDSTYNIQLVATSVKGCTDTVVHTVTAFGIPDVDFAASPITQLYPRATVNIENLSGTGYVDYQWDFNDGETRLDPVMVENFSHSYATWGDYKISLSIFSNNCSDIDTQWVHILAPQPETTINPGLRASGCEDLSVDFQAYTNYADTFEWNFGDGGTSSLENPPYIYDTPGTYIVTLSAGGPGTNGELVEVRKDTVKVFIVPTAQFEALPDTVMLPDQPVICHNNSLDADIYQWNFGGIGDSISTEKSPVHYYTEAGVYTITLDIWTNNGCHADTVQYPIVVEPAGTFQFPNAFNPYSDYELNKTFKPLHRGIREYTLEVFNRWGEKVFESTDPEVGWDGRIDGKIGAQDVYAWKLVGKYRNGTLFKATGNVTLVR